MDEMTIQDINTGKDKLLVDSENKVKDVHDCTFHSFDPAESCIYCNVLLADFIIQSYNRFAPKVPIIDPNATKEIK